ncbi:MAG: galactokinase [Chloroflexota bacterium]|nr:MAG: galactokinase [Chloroflexota bacterium]
MSDERFHDLFGGEPSVRGSAAGRVNLIGEHTDYNGGFVLPTAIPQRTSVWLAPRGDRAVRIASAEIDQGAVRAYTLGSERREGNWTDYVQGVTRFLAEEGHRFGGFDAFIASTVPIGSGLSSSAALEVSILNALIAAFGLALDPPTIARIGRRAENEHVGARTGVMDQMAACLADAGTALFLDTRDLSYERVPLPPGAELVVINSGVSHDHSQGDYNARWAECEAACQLLGVAELRDIAIEDLAHVEALPEPLNRRARHVVTENDRVPRAVAAMKANDLAALGSLFDASHASMRDDYVVSVPAVDLLVDIARADADVFGARLTGGGFGGSIVALVRRGAAKAVAERVTRAYASRSGLTPTILVPPR